MGVLLITYDLNAKGQKHNEVLTKIRSFPFWLQLSESRACHQLAQLF